MSKVEIRNHPKYYNVYLSGSIENARLYTKNAVPGFSVYGERLIESKGVEYREWDPYRSKLSALLLQNPISNFLSSGLKCLYLGASSGTTVSHLSDILEDGIIYAVEFAERSIRQLIQNTSNRKNVVPILSDARYPEMYANSVFTEIDLVYQDVAQPNQAEIAIRNCNYFVKKGGILVLAIKSQSIDSVAKSEEVYARESNTIKEAGYELLETVNIDKYAANHVVVVARK